VINDDHALLLNLVQIVGVSRVVETSSEARRPQSDQLALGRAVVRVYLKTIRGDVLIEIRHVLECLRKVVHIHQEIDVRFICVYVDPKELEGSARARELHHLGAHVLDFPLIFPVVNIEEANRGCWWRSQVLS